MKCYFIFCSTSESSAYNYGVIDQQSKLCILTGRFSCKSLFPYTNKIPSAPFVPCQNQFLVMHHSAWTTINLSPAPCHHAPQITGERLCKKGRRLRSAVSYKYSGYFVEVFRLKECQWLFSKLYEWKKNMTNKKWWARHTAMHACMTSSRSMKGAHSNAPHDQGLQD